MGQDLKHMPLNPWRLKESGVDDHGEEAMLAGPFGMVGGLLYPNCLIKICANQEVASG